LIAIDASRGKDVNAAASAVIDALKAARIDCAISRFDASGLFGELASVSRSQPRVSMRTLTLVYAADLAFRLRWEIRPVLEAGGVVIASPYIETAVALGAACGLDEAWVRDLLRFAPTPQVRARAEERKPNKGWKPRLDRGYAEYSTAMLKASSPKVTSRSVRHRAIRLLEARGRKVFRLSDTGVDQLVKSVTDSLRAAPRRSVSKPRNARK
jgi:hypothetical protein